ncbi:uncharacterized protein DS421_18g627220 [Arachis hypogaea]|nr:uncharacterized protein DS421_18g627220 [Arachis hypogaea]
MKKHGMTRMEKFEMLDELPYGMGHGGRTLFTRISRHFGERGAKDATAGSRESNPLSIIRGRNFGGRRGGRSPKMRFGRLWKLRNESNGKTFSRPRSGG